MVLARTNVAVWSSRAVVAAVGTSMVRATMRLASSASWASWSAYQESRVPRAPPVAPLAARIKPTSPAYYTGRPAYIDTVLSLEELTREVKRLLEQANLVRANSGAPSLAAARQNMWVSTSELERILGTNLKAAQYRQVIARLGLLARYATLMRQLESTQLDVHKHELVSRYNATLQRYMNESAKANDALAQTDTDHALWLASQAKIDASGRAYSMGRRKESSAQVWIVAAQQVGSILVNNRSIDDYFTRTAERQLVTWPMKLTSTLAAYNVFALCRGGGKSGQAAALAHALANAIVAHTGHNLPIQHGLAAKKYVKDILAKDGVLKRDPRMVERKKTGLAKARKAFTWVKR